MLNLLKTIWRSWKKAVHGLNAAISFTLMALVYWFALLPVAVGFRLFKRDALDRGPGDATALTAWTPIRSPREDIRRAQRPW